MAPLEQEKSWTARGVAAECRRAPSGETAGREFETRQRGQTGCGGEKTRSQIAARPGVMGGGGWWVVGEREVVLGVRVLDRLKGRDLQANKGAMATPRPPR
ncbi:hypothetical protein J1614_009804 [Plenodomus biglobosus]|nr:hypothetical protein J1614_009804 [Plenodomus biglobosus]